MNDECTILIIFDASRALYVEMDWNGLLITIYDGDDERICHQSSHI
jgi:hypothetical protein